MKRLRTSSRTLLSASAMSALVPYKRQLASLMLVMLAAGMWLATPVWADPFFFSTGTPDGLLGALSQPASDPTLETETADDFILSETTSIAQATITGLIVPGTALDNISNIEIEIYHVFPKDSGDPQPGRVPSRVNSPADVEIETATRDGSQGTLSFDASVLAQSFSVLNTVADGIHQAPDNVTQGEGSASGKVVQITITFTPPVVLPADHYFFRPEIEMDSGDFLYLSAPKPIVAPGTPFTGDLQAWIRNSNLKPDWLRIGTDIIGGTTPPTFNMSLSLTGETVAQVGTPTATATPTPTTTTPPTATATMPPSDNGGSGCSVGAARSANGARLWLLLAPAAMLGWTRRRRGPGTTLVALKRGVVKSLIAAALVMVVGKSAAADFPTFPLRRCGADAVLAGTVCLDRFEASVWRIPDPTTTNAVLVRKVQLGNVTRADLIAGGATQLGTTGDDYAPCAKDGQTCANDIYAVSIEAEIPSTYITWFQAQEACANARKRLPTNAEWQVGANGTPDAGPDNGTTDCNTASDGGSSLTGTRGGCVAARGAFDMVGNLAEWVADWVPASTNCPGWASFSDDEMCLAGASTTANGPGALVRGGAFASLGGAHAGPFAVHAFAPFHTNNFVGFRCAR